VDPFGQYPVLRDLLKPFSRRHQKTMALVIAGIAVAGQARSFAIATCMKSWLGVRLDSAVNRFYRLLRNSNVDYTELAASWANVLARSRSRHLVVAIDWTEWHHDLRLLVAAVVAGRRALPLFVQGTRKLVRARSQNAYENTFLRVLADALKRAQVTVTILCDRGFRRVSWIHLLQRLQLGFVVRLMDDVCVAVEGHVVPLATIQLPRGKVVDLGVVPLRSDGAVMVRVIGYWARNAKEPWWVATSETGDARKVLKLYDRRMTVEEQFRDLKGKRFGAKLVWTQFRDPEALARFVMLLAVALLIWQTTGIAAARRDKSLRMTCRKKGARQSYITIGIRIVVLDRQTEPLTLRRLARRLEQPHLRKLGRAGFGGAK
jgi:Transposase DDE domain